MMHTVIRKQYFARRRFDVPASRALAIARLEYEQRHANIPRYSEEPVQIDLPDGTRIVMRLEPDYDSESMQDCEFMRTATNDEVAHASERWINRDGLVMIDVDRRGMHYDWRMYRIGRVTISERVAWLRKTYGRHDAWLVAREAIAEETRQVYACRDASYVGWITTHYAADGTEIEEESCWGYPAIDYQAGLDALEAAKVMMRGD